jgi:hypothetical protein
VPVSKQQFPAGAILGTPGAIRALECNNQSPLTFLDRHLSRDWGNISEEDKKENEFSLAEGFRLLSAYSLNDGTKIWVITEADRSVTTFLLPEEY